MREFGNKGLQISTESTKNSSSSTSNESFSVDPSVSKTNNAANLSSHNSNKKRAHSGHSKSHAMPHESNDTGNKRKEVSGITRPDLQRSVPTFLSKLYNMVNDPASTDLIRWSTDGTSFIVERHEEFAAKVLPRFFKHNTFASFVRQLNMYDFHKVPHIMQGVLVSENEGEVWEFSNSNFQRDQPDLLLLVSRKRSRDRDEKDTNSSELSQLINDIASIKRHQTTISTDLRNLQRDNLILWQDNLAAREKHERHQDMIQKILRFLASVFSSNQIETFSKQKDFILENRPESESSVDAIYNPGMTTPSPQSHTRTVNQGAIDLNLPGLIQSAKAVVGTDKPIESSAPHVPLTTASVVAAALGARPFDPSPSPVSRHTSESPYGSGSQPQPQPQRWPPSSPALSSKGSETQALDNINISQQSSDLAAVAKSAESINDEIDTLQDHIESLATQLGFDPGNFGDDIDGTDIAMFMNSHDNMIAGASYNDRMSLFDMIGSPQAKSQAAAQSPMTSQDGHEPTNETLKQAGGSPYGTAPNSKYNSRPWTPNPHDARQKKVNSLTTLLDELTGLYQAMGGVLKPPVAMPGAVGPQYAWPPPPMVPVPSSHSEPPTSGGPSTSQAYHIPIPVIASPYVPPHHNAVSALSQTQAARSSAPVAPPIPGMYDPATAPIMAGTATPGYPGYPYMGQPMYPGMYYAMPPGMSPSPVMPSTTAPVSTPGEDSEPSTKRLRTDSPIASAAAAIPTVSGTPPHPGMPHMGVPPYHPAYAHMAPHMMYGQMPASGPVYPFYASAFPHGYGYPSHPHVPAVAGYPGITTPMPTASPEPTYNPSAGASKPNVPGSEGE